MELGVELLQQLFIMQVYTTVTVIDVSVRNVV